MVSPAWKSPLEVIVVIAWLRRLRHGRLRRLGPVWIPLGRVYRWLMTRRWLRRSVRMRIGAYGPFRLDAYFAFSDLEHWGAAHNEGFAACVERCRGAGDVVDVGAHVGFVTLPMSSVIGPTGQVFAFEPGEVNRNLLERHVALNAADNVVILDKLVGATDREQVTFWELDYEPTGMNSVVSRADTAGYREVTRAQVTLDGFCERHGVRPEVVKIDVEGAELDVLEGARRTLREQRPWLFLSVHPRHLRQGGRSVEELVAFLDEVGYECRTVDGDVVGEFGLKEYLVLPREALT